MTPLEWFGLPPGADERAIKRAYAQRLRRTRPEDDPEGFQQLHAIYQQALAHGRHAAAAMRADPVPDPPATGAAGMDEAGNANAAGESVPRAGQHPQPATPARAGTARIPPAAGPRMPVHAFALEDVCAEAFAMATAGDPVALHAWLLDQPQLWSLQNKTLAARRLMQRLMQQQPPMSAGCLETLLRFFDLDHALTGYDPLALQQAGQRMQLRWELQPAHRGELYRRLRAHVSSRRALDRRLAWHAAPFRWPRILALGLAPARVVGFLTTLSHGHLQNLPPEFDRKAIQFWRDAANRAQVTRARLAMGAVRWLLGILACALAGFGLSRLDPDPARSWELAPVMGGIAFTVGLIWLAWMAYLPIERWHGCPEYLPARWPWLNLLLVPLLCATGLGLQLLLPRSSLAWIPLVPALWLAIRRCWMRLPPARRPQAGLLRVGLFLLVPLLRFAAMGSRDFRGDVGGWPLIVVAMAAWGIDLWHQRGRLRIISRPA